MIIKWITVCRRVLPARRDARHFGSVKESRRMPWRLIVIENVVMIGILAAYEAIFVNVVVLHYDSISMPELDQLVVDNALSACV